MSWVFWRVLKEMTAVALHKAVSPLSFSTAAPITPSIASFCDAGPAPQQELYLLCHDLVMDYLHYCVTYITTAVFNLTLHC